MGGKSREGWKGEEQGRVEGGEEQGRVEGEEEQGRVEGAMRAAHSVPEQPRARAGGHPFLLSLPSLDLSTVCIHI